MNISHLTGNAGCPIQHTFIAALLVLFPVALAASEDGSFDSGGGISSSASYSVTASLGSVGGDSAAGSISNSGGGSVIQPSARTLNITASPSSVNEGGTSQFSGMATLEDDSVTILSSSDISWGISAWPIQGISASGLATTDWVYADTSASANCTALGVSGSGQLLVLDSVPDNFGLYAGDQVPDDWQVHYFGVNNTNGIGSADADGTGQNNLFKYVAGLDPTNRNSIFMLRIEPVPGQSGQKHLVFSPRHGDRTYTPQFRTDLASGTWSNLAGHSQDDNGVERTNTDLSATEPNKFYRVQIRYP